MIKVLQETTDWPFKGVYHVNSSNELVAYQANENSPVKNFKNPMKNFSKSRRKFKLLREYEEKFDSDVKVVNGSNGNTYTIKDGKCSCPGFTFRGKCKHTAEVK